MKKQSTNHLFMIEPASFYANPETLETNAYQIDEHEPPEEIYARALQEFRTFRDTLIEAGVIITAAKGLPECPDMVFPNWASTHREIGGDPTLFLYPMLNNNRQKERDPALVEMFKRLYPNTEDWTGMESEGNALESTASIVMDRVNKNGYAALSPRTDKNLARLWCADMGYALETFQTRSHTGIPVYHTDCVMWIGTTLAGICTEAIIEEDRERILAKLKSTHEVVEFTSSQLRAFCGNALEVIGKNNQKFLAMSTAAYEALEPAQKTLILQHFNGIIHEPLPTLEKYGGGSARCMLMELF
ncbi:MAG: arginine deiminase-related protein [Alphaproteobacteria bacterium]